MSLRKNLRLVIYNITYHPFFDGNGRVGRMFIILYLLERQVLSAPVLYISYYLKLNRTEYYNIKLEILRKLTVTDDGYRFI